jgi:hypothetical protein
MSIRPNTKMIRKAMIDKDIYTISDLSKKSGVSRPKIHEFMREETPISTTFIRLCNFLEIDINEAVICENKRYIK